MSANCTCLGSPRYRIESIINQINLQLYRNKQKEEIIAPEPMQPEGLGQIVTGVRAATVFLSLDAGDNWQIESAVNVFEQFNTRGRPSLFYTSV